MNVYVVRDGGDALIVDAGTGDDYNDTRLMRALVRLGLDLSRATVFCTHGHDDHAGLAYELAEAGAEVLMSSQSVADMREIAYVEGRDARAARLAGEGVDPDCARDLAGLMWSRRADLVLEHVAVRTVEPGERVTCGRWSFEVVGTPGHTPGHCILWLPERGIAFTGDALLFACSTFISFWDDAPDSLGSHIESLHKIADMGIEQAFIGHGEQTGDIAELARKNIGHHERRIARAVEAVRRAPGRAGVDLVEDLGWRALGDLGLDGVPPLTRWFILAESIAVLDCAVHRGAVRRERDARGISRYYSE